MGADAEPSELSTRILQSLYVSHFSDGDGILRINEWASAQGEEARSVWDAYKDLQGLGLSEPYALGSIQLTADGALWVEAQALVETDLADHQRAVRTSMLNALFTYCEEHGGCLGMQYLELVRQAGITKADYDRNSRLLADAGLMECVALGMWAITPEGRSAVVDYRRRRDRLEELQRLSTSTKIPSQRRGHLLEDLLGAAIRDSGWEVQVRSRSQGQEHDVIANLGLDYYFISCKWVKRPVQAHEVELLESRVRSRAGTRGGILASMSGFTTNCVDETRMKINSAMVLLFGPDDIECVIGGFSNFTDLLSAKLEEAMHHRKILVDGKAR